MEQQCDEVINLLWTGGWDSTFRLLQLLLLQEKIVQPHYLIDSDRPSTGVEIRTMENIKKRLFADHVQTRDILLPTKFKEVSDIHPNQEITAKFERILKHTFMGSQYEWLARFCSETGIKDIELSIHRDDKAHQVLEPFIVQFDAEKGTDYRLNETFKGTDEYDLFRFFRFPLFNWTKLDMQNAAGEEGFEDYLNLTWFCHKPLANSRPCGVCNPCIYTIEEGLGKRIPLSSRIKYHFRILPRIKQLNMKYPALYSLLRSMKQRALQRKT